MQESKKEIEVKEAKSTKEEWLKQAQLLEDQGKIEQAEQIRAKYLGYEYISQERLEQILKLALDPAKKENEVKKERKQLYEYAVHHRQFDWIDQLAKLQLQRAMLYMREYRQTVKEFEKSIRLNRVSDVKNMAGKYGAGLRTEHGANGLMLALLYGHQELIQFFLQAQYPIDSRDNAGWLPFDYLITGYYKTTIDKQQQYAKLNIIRQFGEAVMPRTLTIQVGSLQFKLNKQNMVLMLLCIMRCRQQYQPRKIKIEFPEYLNQPPVITGSFDMDEIELLASLLPDEILAPYRKKRSYLNSVLASNEITRIMDPNCKITFRRFQRGIYMLNPGLKFV